MSNRDLTAAQAYHDGTKHSYRSVRMGARGLDWANQPLPFKIYTTLEPIPLPRDFPQPAIPALDAIAARAIPTSERRVPDLDTLAGIFYFSAGITKRLRRRGGTMDFRAAACTGALYHIELYLICGELPGVAAGVYHFGVHDFALRRLRTGDHRGHVVRATGAESVVAAAPAIVVCTTTFWRNAWKYGPRAYRHAFWDSGTILANLLAVSAAYGVSPHIVCGFVDADINRLLDLHTEREVVISLVALGRDATSAEAARGEDSQTPQHVPALELPTEPLSRTEVDYPAIRAMHEASSLRTVDEVVEWRRGAAGCEELSDGKTAAPEPAAATPGASPGTFVPLQPLAEAGLPRDSIARAIRRRGSARAFAPEPIGFQQLSTLLDRATRGIAADFLPRSSTTETASTLNTLYLIVHAVEGLASGAYVFDRRRRGLELLQAGMFRERAGYLGLEQELPADASVNVYLLADLRTILDRFGNRGYRAAQLDAAITGGKLYLAAYSLRLGATGLTFYDDDVIEFFSPHAAGKSVMFLVALGEPARLRR